MPLVLALLGCAREAACDRVVHAVCDLQGSRCGVYDSAEACEAEVRDQQECSPDVPLSEFDACVEDATASACTVGLPASCAAVLCSNGGAGCGGTVAHETGVEVPMPTATN